MANALLSDIPLVTGAAYRNLVLALPLAVASILFVVSVPTTVDLALTPLYFLLLNLAEYLLHRGPMHHSGTPMFEHVTRHHMAFPSTHLTVANDDDNFYVLVPPKVYVAAMLVVMPLSILAGHHGLFFAGCFSFYYFVEELLHFVAHSGRFAVFAEHHLTHHRNPRCNFNINFPIFDWLLVTLAG